MSIPAFPTHNAHPSFQGMDLRDYFAAAALTGFLVSDEMARQRINPGGRFSTAKEFADAAYEMADAMMAKRKVM